MPSNNLEKKSVFLKVGIVDKEVKVDKMNIIDKVDTIDKVYITDKVYEVDTLNKTVPKSIEITTYSFYNSKKICIMHIIMLLNLLI